MAGSPYPGLLTLHLIAVVLFLGGLVLDAAALPGLSRGPLDARRRAEAVRLRRFALSVTTPALALVWACGIAMAVRLGWYEMGWLRVKAALVLLLSAIHAAHLVTLGRLARGEAVRPRRATTLVAIIAAAGAIVALVVTKAF